jgi:type II secretion system-associated lipoprotein
MERIITKEELKNKNRELSSYIFTAKADIYPHFIENVESNPEKLLKKGDKVTLDIELSGSWIRVKAFTDKSKRQQAVGKTVIYIFKQDIVKGEKVNDLIEKHIENMFTRSPVKK